ncbi:MAG: sulfatase-like hydrolase/transferase [Candidatus Brocadiia bacterium]
MNEKRPNILFLMTDHQRADSIGMVQDGKEVTPHLNRLAEQGTFFPRAYNTCPLCVPTRTALFTGQYPIRNGVVYNDWRGKTAGDHTVLMELLADAGYRVGHVGVDHVRVAPSYRERVPWGLWVDGEDYRRHLEAEGLSAVPPEGTDPYKREIDERQEGERETALYSNTRVGTAPLPAEEFKDAWWCRRAVDYLSAAGDEPFALFTFLWAPHPPLIVPEPYASMFDPDNLALPPNVDVPAEGEPPGRRKGAAAQIAEGLSMEEWRRVWAAHLGLVRLADQGIGRILSALKESGRGEDTIVIFTVDHGDHLGQHRMYQKMEMYEQAIRVPLIVRLPGGRSETFGTPVWHLDIMPTLLDMLGLEAPDVCDGVSVRETLESGPAPPERTLFCQYSGNPALGDIRRAAVTERWKYVYTPDDEPELYDLANDPQETVNIAGVPAYADVVEDLHARCRSWGREVGDWVDYG